MTLNGQNALCYRNDVSFGAHCTTISEKNLGVDCSFSFQKSRYSWGFLLAGASKESGVVDDGNFWRAEWLLQKLQR